MVPRIYGRLPPLHIDIHNYQEDMRGSEDNSFNISSEDQNQDSSFQEALIREKVEKRRENKNSLTVLCRTTPHKKVTIDDSGWWNIDSEVITSQLYNFENSNTIDDSKLYYINKNDECYKPIINPINKQLNTTLDKPDPKYDLSNNHEIEINKQNKEIKIYDINKQVIFIKVKGMKIKKR